jgi:tRNA(Ile)-lysidine synthase
MLARDGSEGNLDAMARTLTEGVRAAVRRYALLDPGDVVLVAVSGGADSVALLGGLLDLRGDLGITVAAAHLDHRLRGAESAADRRFVEALAARFGVPCVSEAVDVPAGNLEAEARRVRYAFLERAADGIGATKIATAHTRDDQAETVLLRLVRGAGRRGLGGIRPRRGRIVRPLLLCDRIQLRAFLVERGLDWRRDHSNFDLASERARVRHGFLPALARELNPRLSANLAELADVMREEDALLDRLAAATARHATVAIDVVTALEPPLARRAVRHWWRRHGSGRRIGRAHVEGVCRLAARASDDGEIAVPGGAVVRAARGLTFRPGPPPTPRAPYRLPLTAGDEVRTPAGWTLALAEAAPGGVPTDDTVCVVDADRVGGLEVRNREPGDRLRLHGLAGHTSIKRLLNARGVPRHLRSDYPLVIADGEVLWVPGCARSDRALVGATTKRCYVIRLTRRPNESA